MNTLLLIAALALSQADIPVALDMLGPACVPSKLQVPADSPNLSLPHLDVYAPSWCSGCKTAVDQLMQAGLYQPVIYIDSRGYPDKVKNLIAAGGQYPVILWQNYAGQEVQISDGWKGIANFARRFNASLQPAVARYAPPTPTGQSVPGAGAYPVHPVTWHIIGSAETRQDLIHHLSSDGIHRGKFSRAWLETLSRAQLMSLHHDDHEGRALAQIRATKDFHRSRGRPG